ncbi:hypothetical protein V5799_010337 [Amblyomma americanum]|uniref:t-SNARE coiled-coil homology domain-containing protein n=1 Tax=Amblyomma americanum TaxID=6943 RepID=A0AAQ4F9J1_AMBAM
MASNRADAAETDEQRFLRELRRLLAEPDDAEVQPEGEQQRKPQLDDDPSIEATRNLLRACQEAQGIGLRTVTVLESQGEQLDNVEEALEKLSADLGSAEGHLSEIRRPLFSFCPWRCRWKKKKKRSQDGAKENKGNNNKAQEKPERKPRALGGGKASSKETEEPSKTSSRSDSAGSDPERPPVAQGHRDSVSREPGQHPDDQLGAALTDLKGIAQARSRGSRRLQLRGFSSSSAPM